MGEMSWGDIEKALPQDYDTVSAPGYEGYNTVAAPGFGYVVYISVLRMFRKIS